MQRGLSVIAAKVTRNHRTSELSRAVKEAQRGIRSPSEVQWRNLATKSTAPKSAPRTAKSVSGRSRFISKEAEEALNTHINAEYNAHYAYLAMACHFSKNDVALAGFAAYFTEQSDEERTHAKQMIDYLLKRGGSVDLKLINAPATENLTPLAAFQKSLEMEEDIYDKLLHLHKIAGDTNDPNLSDFLEGTFLTEQVQALKTVSDHVTNLRRVGSTDLGIYLYDKQLAGTLNAADVLNNGGAPA